MKKLLVRALIALVALAVVGGTFFYLRPVACFKFLQHAKLQLKGFEYQQITVNGIRLNYATFGPQDGRPVVLVHGLGGNVEDWRNLAPYLAKAGFRVYMPDLPGFGRSERPANYGYSIHEQEATVVAFLDALNLKQVELGGWSMGGWIAQRIAIDHPERITRLILFDSAGLRMKPNWDTRLFMPQTPAEIDLLDALLMPNPPHVPGFIARDVVRVSNDSAWVTHRALSQMLSAKDVTDEQLKTLKMPTLIVWDEQDKITPLDEGIKIRESIQGSELFQIRGCGHMAPVNCSKQIGPKIAEFLKAGNSQ